MTPLVISQPGSARWLVRAALAVTLVLTSCQSPAPRQATPEERAAYGQALSPLPQQPGVAKQRLEAFVEMYPRSPLADDAAEKLAVIELGLGDAVAAETWVAWALREHPRGDRAESARLALAGMARDRGDEPAARRLFANARFDRMTAAQQRVAYRMLADLAPTGVDRLRWLAELYRVTAGAPARARARTVPC